MKRALAYLALIIAITGCIYPFEVTLPQQDSPSIVVDANIKIGAFSEVALRYVQPLDNFSSGSTFPAGSVYIESESGEKYTTKGDKGVFSIDTRMASVSKKYRIVVNADGETIVSDWCTPLPPPIVSDVRIWADELAVFVSADIDASEGSTGYIAVSFYELWRFHADYIRQYGYDPIDKIIYSLMEYDLSHYWCWKTNMPKEEVFLDLNLSGGKVGDLVVTRFGRSNSRNHDDYTVTVLARNVSESEYRFRSLMRENVSNGGNLLISGAYIATDLVDAYEIDPDGAKFAADVLKIKWMTHSASKDGRVSAVNNKFGFNGSFNFYNELNDKKYLCESPDAFTPVGDNAFTIFRYPQTSISAATAYNGSDYKVVAFGFPLETLKEQSQINDLVGQVLSFFKGE